MVPDSWKLLPIKDICACIIDCVNKTAPVVGERTSYKMIRTTNVRNGRVDTNEVRYVTKETFKKWSRRGLLEVGDLVLTREAPVGEVGLLENSEGVFLGQRTVMYRVDPNKSNNLFLLHSLSSSYCQKQIKDLSNGGTVTHLRVPDCGEILIKTPPLTEQIKIAKILSTWDKAIETVEKLITNSQQQKKALIQTLLDNEKKCNEYKLNDLFQFKKGKGLSKDKLNTTGKYKCVLYGELYTKYEEVIKDVISRTDYCEGLLSMAGDILIPSSTTTSGIDLANATAIFEDNVLLGGDINILRPNTKLTNSIFVAYLLTHIKKHDIASRAQGITIIHLYSSDLKNIKINIPGIEQQEKIARVLANADCGISIMKSQLIYLQQEKKALMQQLLTGKRRVKVKE